MKKIISLWLLFIVPNVQAQSWNALLPSNRAVDWTGAGIPGGIPSGTWSQCGPTLTTSATATTIVNAMNHTGTGYTGCASNTYIQLAAGTFNLSAGIDCKGCNNTELRGMGADQTHLVFTGGVACENGIGSGVVCAESTDSTTPTLPPPSTIVNWTAGYSQGATQITLSSGANITLNSTMIVLDQCDTGFSGSPCSGTATDNSGYFNCGMVYASTPTGCSFNGPDTGAARPNRFQTEMVEATACSPSPCAAGSTVVTITPALQHPNWASGNTPQAYLIQPCKNVGFRDFSVDSSALTGAPFTMAVDFFNCSYVWATGLQIQHVYSQALSLRAVIHANFESNYIFDAGQNGVSGDPSGINYTGSNNLIQNNIVQKAHVQIIANGPHNGNVVAYNYLINAYGGDSFLFPGLWTGHSNGGDLDLYEGNVVNQLIQDQTHGTQLLNTGFRNFFTSFESCANSQCGASTAKDTAVFGAGLLSYNRYGNWIANILGTPSIDTAGYTLTQNGYILFGTTGYPWNVGSGNASGGVSPPIPLDSVVNTTTVRWGNYDTFNNAVLECTGVHTPIVACPDDERAASAPSYPGLTSPATTFPASFYLSSRPIWWSTSIPFPAIGPDVTSGNVGQVSGTINTSGKQSGTAGIVGVTYAGNITNSAWGGHINAIPSMACYLNVLGGPPDGSGSALTFSRAGCYSGSAPVLPSPATNVFVAFP